ncbi:MAG: glycoside hydrolase family 3 C-terminal domain-containing protein, partial [Bacteroidota bacterium]
LGDEVKISFAASNKADSAVIAARESDIAIVCIGNHPLSYGLGWGQNHVFSDGREEVDRQAISIEQEDLVKLVMAANSNTVLVLVSSFPYAINWSKENVPAILHVTQSSQEMGNGVADIVFGKESPAGRLVQTWSASIDQLLPILEYDIRKGRTYMYDKNEALFPFGHGLSYTTFEYSDLSMEKETIEDGETMDVSITVTNKGDMDSDEVVQLYVGFPDSEVERPIKALKGFRRIHVPAGESIRVSIPLEADELRYWNVEEHKFVLEKGTINVMVGASSKDIRLRGELEAI